MKRKATTAKTSGPCVDIGQISSSAVTSILLRLGSINYGLSFNTATCFHSHSFLVQRGSPDRSRVDLQHRRYY